jgi:sec-independent protein translocase protein TatA
MAKVHPFPKSGSGHHPERARRRTPPEGTGRTITLPHPYSQWTEEAPVPVLANIIGPELLIVLAIALLLFGSSRLPHLARSLGSAKNEFERGLNGTPDDHARERDHEAAS